MAWNVTWPIKLNNMTRHKIALLNTAILMLEQLPILAQSERYFPMGIDDFNKKTVYLDMERVKKINTTSYQYTLSSESDELDTGKPGRFEEDLVVDCNQIGSIVHLGSRLYDGEGRLIKIDQVSRTQDIIASQLTPYINANHRLCSEMPKS